MKRLQRVAENYVPELDGLRALAVLPVIAFHFGADVNGPAGVTVFFALSGFIVTTVLVRERERSGTVRLDQFYVRRLRRLLPAATIVVVATVLVGWLMSNPPIVRQAIAALTYWADFERYTSTYSYGATSYAPLEHFWSLAIEEQFYLVLPVLCLLLLRFGRRPLIVLVTVALIASAWLAQVSRDDPMMYFHPATRACELLVGVVLALLAPRLHAAWGYLGLAALVVILGGFVSPPAVVTALITCVVIAGLPPVLALRPLVVIGLYSYGLYLWHPLAAVISDRTAVRIALTVAFTAACYHLVEHPIRFTLPRPVALRSMVALSVVGLVVAAVPLGRLTPKFVPPAPVFAADEVATTTSTAITTTTVAARTNPITPTSSAATATNTTTTMPPRRPLRISAAGDSTQMFADVAWQRYAAVYPADVTWVMPPDDIAIWTSGADNWIRDVAPTTGLSLPFDGPQGGLDRRGCPLIYDVPIRPVSTYRFVQPAKVPGPGPIESCDWHLWIPSALERMDVDVLAVSWAVTAMWDYQLPDGREVRIGDPTFDAVLKERMNEFEAMAAGYGTTILWMTYAPVSMDAEPAPWARPETADAMAGVILQRSCTADVRSLTRSDPDFDWYQDGYHFTPVGAARAVSSIAESMKACQLLE